MSTLETFTTVAAWVAIGWEYCAVSAVGLWLFGARDGRLVGALVRMHQELWIFAPPGLLLFIHAAVQSHKWISALGALVVFACWWALRDWPDDNIWKRRGKRALDRVRAVAGRLVVSPA